MRKGFPRNFTFFNELFEFVEVLVIVDAVTDHLKAFVAIFLTQLLNFGKLRDAPSAPRRPEIDEHDFAAIGFPVDLGSVDEKTFDFHLISDEIIETRVADKASRDFLLRFVPVLKFLDDARGESSGEFGVVVLRFPINIFADVRHDVVVRLCEKFFDDCLERVFIVVFDGFERGKSNERRVDSNARFGVLRDCGILAQFPEPVGAIGDREFGDRFEKRAGTYAFRRVVAVFGILVDREKRFAELTFQLVSFFVRLRLVKDVDEFANQLRLKLFIKLGVFAFRHVEKLRLAAAFRASADFLPGDA